MCKRGNGRMTRWNAELERREAMRTAKRLRCAIWIGGDRHDGVLEQVSAHAVEVRMKAVPPGAHEAKLTFSTPDGVDFALRAMPVRGRIVPHTLRGLLPPTVVMQVLEPTDAFLRWVDAPAVGAS